MLGAGKSLLFKAVSLVTLPFVAAGSAVGQTIPVLNGDIEKVFTSTSDPGWLEGPAYDGAGHIWFTDLVDAFGPPPPPATSIMRFNISSGTTEVAVEGAGGANGLGFDGTGRLIAAEGHHQRVTRRPLGQADEVEVLAENWQGMPLTAPNDLAFDAQGGIYFTDFVLPPPESAVYYLDPAGDLQQVSKGIPINNGIALSPGGETLFVASTAGGSIFALDVNDDGTLSNERVFAAPTGMVPDGLTVDRFGNLYAADLALVGGPPPTPGLPGSKVRVWNNAGEEVLRFEPPEGVINLTFGPSDGGMLYFTSEKSLWQVPIAFVPVPSKPGDFDGDSLLTAMDIDMLSEAAREGVYSAIFDLNADNNVNAIDHTVWVEQHAETLLGDADLDHSIQFSDFLVLADNFTQPGGWAQGDFDGTGVVQFSDFLLLSSNFGRSGQAIAAVPEPSGLILTMLALVGILFRRQTNC